MWSRVQTIAGSPFRVNWAAWQARDRAVLCFVRREGRLLLIRKKRGLGAGKFNGPGGRIEPGETPEAAAVRETQEELGVTPTALAKAGASTPGSSSTATRCCGICCRSARPRTSSALSWRPRPGNDVPSR
jgi:8-oxo-dGTP pyrophosphatase MutT (NUDIX family)